MSESLGEIKYQHDKHTFIMVYLVFIVLVKIFLSTQNTKLLTIS